MTIPTLVFTASEDQIMTPLTDKVFDAVVGIVALYLHDFAVAL